MPLFRRILAIVVVCLANFSVAQIQDQIAAERVLGPHWRQIARTSGMIFAGTVLKVESQPAGKGRPLPLMVATFHVDRPIAGVRAGEPLTIHEWEGAWAAQRAMLLGQRLLIFLYPASRLGLTSPVGGRSGQVVLDARGEIVGGGLRGDSRAKEGKLIPDDSITLAQLERAIRSARLTRTVNPRRRHARTISDD